MAHDPLTWQGPRVNSWHQEWERIQMACSRNEAQVALSGDGSGFETEEKARAAAAAHARAQILAVGASNGARPCIQEGCDNTGKCIRVASKKTIDALIIVYDYDDTDDDQSW